MTIRASSKYLSGNPVGTDSGANFVFCLYGKFQLGYRDEKRRDSSLWSFFPLKNWTRSANNCEPSTSPNIDSSSIFRSQFLASNLFISVENKAFVGHFLVVMVTRLKGWKW